MLVSVIQLLLPSTKDFALSANIVRPFLWCHESIFHSKCFLYSRFGKNMHSMSSYKQILWFCYTFVHQCGKIRWASQLCGSVLFDGKLEIFRNCNLHNCTNITQYRGMKFISRFLVQHTKHPLYTHKTWNIHKNSVFTHNIQPTMIHVFHVFLKPKFASSKKLKKQCKVALDAIYSKLKMSMQNIQTFLVVL